MPAPKVQEDHIRNHSPIANKSITIRRRLLTMILILELSIGDKLRLSTLLARVSISGDIFISSRDGIMRSE